MVSGSRVGVPAGRALYQLNDRMTGEERALARRECALFMDADGFVSPAKLYVWFATGTDCILSVCFQRHWAATRSAQSSLLNIFWFQASSSINRKDTKPCNPNIFLLLIVLPSTYPRITIGTSSRTSTHWGPTCM